MLFVAVLPLQSCGSLVGSATANALEAAKGYWEENKAELVASAGEAAKDYWADNKGEILSAAKDMWEGNKEQFIETAKLLADKAKDAAIATALEYKDSAIEAAKAYTDTQMAEKKETALDELLKSGVLLADIDADGNGEVSDDELNNYLKGNPTKLLVGGGVGLWWALWQLKNLMRRKDSSKVVTDPPRGRATT